MSDLLDLFRRVSIAVVHCVRLERHDLLTLVHVVLELTSLCFKLLTLHAFFSKFTFELLLGFVNGLNPLVGVLLELLDLVFKSLLVFLVLLLMLSLDDFLSLLSDSVKLNILSSLLEVGDFKIKSLLDISYPLEIGFELRDLVHEFDFLVSLVLDLVILQLNDIFRDENCIFVISCNWKLRNLNPSLSEIYNTLEVEPNLLDPL